MRAGEPGAEYRFHPVLSVSVGALGSVISFGKQRLGLRTLSTVRGCK